MQTHSATYLVGLPLLGSPLVAIRQWRGWSLMAVCGHLSIVVVLVASGPSSLFVDGGVGCLWTFVGSRHRSSIMVVDPRSQSSMVMVGAHCVSWGLPEESVVVTCDIMFITSPNWDVSNSIAFLSFVTLCRG